MAKRMAEQMELFEPVERGFDEGGLMEEGGMVDEESGNEVPPGSLREEVRDDIPAQLSEGEFVFPADVVRYIGLENLMRMRQEAKQGLSQMEAMGQMGNGDEAVMPDDLPFDMYDLDIDDEGEYNSETRNYQVGGYVPPSVSQQPYNQPTQVDPRTGTYTLPGTGIAGYQVPSGTPTGYVPYGGATPYFQPVQFTGAQYQTALQTTNLPTFAETVGSKPGQYDELRTYQNDAGQTLQIPFKDGKPIYPIPEGYRPIGDQPAPEEDTPTTVTPTVGQAQVRGDGGDGVGTGGDFAGSPFGGNLSTLESSAYSKAVTNLGLSQLTSLSPTVAVMGQLSGKPTANDVAVASNTARTTAVTALGLDDISQATVSELDAIGSAMNVVSNFTSIGQTAPTKSAATTVARSIAEAIKADKMTVEQAETLSELGMNNRGALTDKNGNSAYNEDDPGTVNPDFDTDALDAINAYAAAMATDDDEDDEADDAAAAAAAKGSYSGLGQSPGAMGGKSSGLGQSPGAMGGKSSGMGQSPGAMGGRSNDNDGERGGGGGVGGGGGAGSAGSSGTGCFAAGTKFFMQDGSLKSVENIKVGDIMMDGGKVRLSIVGDGSNSDWYMYGATKVTGSHAVKEQGVWKFTRDTENAVPTETENLLYTIVNANHRMVAEDSVVYSDYDMVDEDGIEEELLEMMNLQEVVEEAA